MADARPSTDRAASWADVDERIERLLAALRFYADPLTYQTSGWQGDQNPAPITSDGGHRARQAMQPVAEAVR